LFDHNRDNRTQEATKERVSAMLPNASNKVAECDASTATADVSGVYNASNPAWTKFSAELDIQLTAMDERFRPYWTKRAVRASVGR
jgi:hypothetical protein